MKGGHSEHHAPIIDVDDKDDDNDDSSTNALISRMGTTMWKSNPMPPPPSPPPPTTKTARSRTPNKGASVRLKDVALLLSLGANMYVINVLAKLSMTQSFPANVDVKFAASNATKPFVRSPVIYGHLHYAKTAGTEINGILAAKYDHVCGHKGYSHDFYQYNERVKQSDKKNVMKIETADLVSKQYSKFNRGRVHPRVMDERGFEDCDYISPELQWEFWQNFTGWPIELHVPCRDPIQHLLSGCNFQNKSYDCETKNFRKATRQCYTNRNRFSLELLEIPNLRLKCFDPIPVDRYVDYMGNFLEHRRFPAEYAHRDSNKKRDKSSECLNTNKKKAAAVRRYLLETNDYYKWCDKCLGSKDDLFA